MQVEEYRSIVGQAQLQELRKAEVILATCSAAASPRMAKGSNVKQVSDDEFVGCSSSQKSPKILICDLRQVASVGFTGSSGFKEP